MIKNKTHRIVTAGLFVAIGLVLPFFTSHAIGMPGTTLLPMHLPVLLCGLLCGPLYGALSGIVIPVLSSILTGMPPIYPMLPIMLVQLFTMGLISGFLYQRIKLHIYISLLASLLAGWALYGLTFAVLTLIGNGSLRALSVSGAVIQGIPGIIIQLILIPVIMSVIKRYFASESPTPSINTNPDGVLAEALKSIDSGRISCVIIKDGSIIHTADGRGVSPLLKIYANQPEILNGAFVVDKIIGKAAAMVLVLGHVKRVYGVVMSVAGREYLDKRGIKAESGRCVDVISNRDRNGICPIEKSVMDIDDPQEGLKVIGSTVANLTKSAANQ